MKKLVKLSILAVMLIGILAGCERSSGREVALESQEGKKLKGEENSINIEEKKENKKENKEEKQDAYENAVLNNGGRYVEYKGNVYYWEYDKDSFESSTRLIDYQPVKAHKNKMICLQADGTKKVLFEEAGSGNIYIEKDMLYLSEEYNGDLGIFYTLYSVDFNGQNRKEYGEQLKVVGYDEENGFMIAEKQGDYYVKPLYGIDTESGEVKLLAEDCRHFLFYQNGTVYFEGIPSGNLGALLRLCSVKADGSQLQVLSEIKTEEMDYPSITHLEVVDGMIYYVYGYYAGTAGFFQKGILMRYNPENMQETKLAETMSEDFFVRQAEGKTSVIYYNEELKSVEKNLSDGTDNQTEFLIYDIGVPFYTVRNKMLESSNPEIQYDIYIYEDHSGTAKKLVDASELDFGLLEVKEESLQSPYYEVTGMDLAGEWVYYTLQVSEYDEENSIGWRDAFKRVLSKAYRIRGEGKTELLFEY